MLYDVIIIGSGPAGISAGLYTKRAGLKTLIISKGVGNLEKAEKIEHINAILPVIAHLNIWGRFSVCISKLLETIVNERKGDFS